MRINLATPLKTRVGDTSKDARLKNAYAEVRGEQSVVRHRPSARGGVAVGTGTAQGGIGFRIGDTDYFIGFWGDTLTPYALGGTTWASGTAYSIGDHVSVDFVDYWALTDHSGSTPPSADWSTDYVPAVPFNPTTWSAGTNISSSGWEEIAYGNNTYVAVADNLATSVATSTDAASWNSRTITSGTRRSIAYGDGKFVTLSYTDVFYSADGITWSAASMPSSMQNLDAYECAYNGVFIASGDNPAGGSSSGIGCAYSSDGITWTSATTWPLGATGSRSVVGCGTNEFIAGTGTIFGGTTNYILRTTNGGVDWSSVSMPSTRAWFRCAYGDGVYIVTALGTSTYGYSTDGTTFTEKTLPVTLPSSGGNGYAISYGGGYFVLVYGSNSYISSDGINWTTLAMGVSRTWSDIVYGNKKFVAIAYSSNSVRVLT